MKKILLVSAMVLAASTAYADNTDTAALTAGGTVITNLTVTAGDDLELPDLVAGDAGTPSSVTLDCSGTSPSVAYTGNGNPYAHGAAGATSVDTASANELAGLGDSSGTCGTADVAGEPNYNIAITTTDPTASADPAITALTCGVPAGTAGVATLDASGNVELSCGATATATVAATPGAYTDITGTITVTYD